MFLDKKISGQKYLKKFFLSKIQFHTFWGKNFLKKTEIFVARKGLTQPSDGMNTTSPNNLIKRILEVLGIRLLNFSE